MSGHLVAALRAIDIGKCERRTTPNRYSCIDEGVRSPTAIYSDYAWCNSCIAHYALEGSDIRDFRPSQFIDRGETINV